MLPAWPSLPNDTGLHVGRFRGTLNLIRRTHMGNPGSVLNPSVTELAAALGVTRQSIYDWQNGGSISASNSGRLSDLAAAVDVLADSGMTNLRQLLRRRLPGGRTFFETIHEGGLAEEAARNLIQLAQKEVAQRRALSERLKSRNKTVGSADDYGAPALNELG